jgi:hypothetical protein
MTYNLMPVRAPVKIHAGTIVAEPPLGMVCIAPSRVLADRIAELLERHGLADVPDHIDELADDGLCFACRYWRATNGALCESCAG